MMLLLDTDADHATRWEGYDFAVCRALWQGKETSTLCRCAANGKWDWTPIAPVAMTRQGREMMVTVPRALVGLQPARGALRFDFKWADGVLNTGNILDFIDQGDVAPNGRFNYRFAD